MILFIIEKNNSNTNILQLFLKLIFLACTFQSWFHFLQVLRFFFYSTIIFFSSQKETKNKNSILHC